MELCDVRPQAPTCEFNQRRVGREPRSNEAGGEKIRNGCSSGFVTSVPEPCDVRPHEPRRARTSTLWELFVTSVPGPCDVRPHGPRRAGRGRFLSFVTSVLKRPRANLTNDAWAASQVPMRRAAKKFETAAPAAL